MVSTPLNNIGQILTPVCGQSVNTTWAHTRSVHELHRSNKRCETKICSSNWIISMDIKKKIELPPASYETSWYFSKLQTWKFPLGFFFNSSVRNWGEFSRIPELKANTAWRHGKLMGENLTKTYRDSWIRRETSYLGSGGRYISHIGCICIWYIYLHE